MWGPGTTDEQSRDEMELEDLAVWLSLVNDDEDDDHAVDRHDVDELLDDADDDTDGDDTDGDETGDDLDDDW